MKQEPKVIIPYANGLQDLVAISLQYDCKPILHHCSEDDSYYKLFQKLWHEKETFVIVEHDIIPWPGAVTELSNCPHMWCLCPYNVRMERGLGCTKFHSDLMRDHPNDFDEPFPRYFNKKWHSMDNYIGDMMLRYKLKPHIHKPNVAHLHKY